MSKSNPYVKRDPSAIAGLRDDFEDDAGLSRPPGVEATDENSDPAEGADVSATPDIGPELEDAVDFLTDFEAHNAGADVRIYRVIEGSRTPGFVLNFPVGTKSYIQLVKELQKKYPEGGDFMIHVKSSQGRHPFLARKRMRLDPSRPPDTDADEHTGMVGLVTNLMERMDNRFEAMMDRLTRQEEDARARLASQPPINPVTQLRELAETIKALTPAPVPALPTQDRDSMKEMLGYMEFYDRIRDRARDEVEPASGNTLVEVLKSLPKLAELLPVLRGGLPALPSPVATPTAEAVTPVHAAGTTVPSRQESIIVNPADLSTLIPVFTLLNKQAELDHDPETYANMILDQGPGLGLTEDRLKELILLPDLVSKIEGTYPAAKQYPDWWAELIKQLREAYSDNDTLDGGP